MPAIEEKTGWATALGAERLRGTGRIAPGRVPALDADKILSTLERLQQRLRERFPQANLNHVAADLRTIGGIARESALFIGRPHLLLRAAAGVLILLLLAVLVFAAMTIRVSGSVGDVGALAQALEAAVNDAIFVGLAIWFLTTLEARLKRRRALTDLHALRSLAHVVDMHQLTKDPEHVLGRMALTSSSPPRTMTRFELARYLDYCSELLSLTSKLAALYVQHFNDPVVLAAVNDVQTLTLGLSNKVWQKIMILDTVALHGATEE